MHAVTSPSMPPAFCVAYFMTGYIMKVTQGDSIVVLYTFRAPKCRIRRPKNFAWKMAFIMPKVPRAVPIAKGLNPKPPYSNGVEYIKGRRTASAIFINERKV